MTCLLVVRREERRGSRPPGGEPADLAGLDVDQLSAAPDILLDGRVLATVVTGTRENTL